MKVLVTGSSGSFGSIVVKNLIERKIPVVGLDVRGLNGKLPADSFKYYRCSVTDIDSLRNIFKEEKPDRVIHFASTFNRVRDPLKEYEYDVVGSRNILQVSDETQSVKQLLFSSSALAYGGNPDNPCWLKETDPLRPGNLRYGLNKKEIEKHYLESKVRDDLSINIIRVCTVVGPKFNKPASVVYILLKWSWLPAFCRENKLQFLHTEDFIAIIDLFLNDASVKGIYNIAPDTYSVVKDLLPGKKFFRLPVPVVKGIMGILYVLRIMNLQPCGINSSIYPIVLDPGKIVERYGYRFRFNSDEAYAHAGIDETLDRKTNLWLD